MALLHADDLRRYIARQQIREVSLPQPRNETPPPRQARQVPAPLGPLRFSLERALLTWLVTLGVGVALTLLVMGFYALPSSLISEGGDSAVGMLIGIVGALIAIVSTLPLALFVNAGNHVEYLVLPNFALVGLVIAGIRGWTREVEEAP